MKKVTTTELVVIRRTTTTETTHDPPRRDHRSGIRPAFDVEAEGVTLAGPSVVKVASVVPMRERRVG